MSTHSCPLGRPPASSEEAAPADSVTRPRCARAFLNFELPPAASRCVALPLPRSSYRGPRVICIASSAHAHWLSRRPSSGPRTSQGRAEADPTTCRTRPAINHCRCRRAGRRADVIFRSSPSPPQRRSARSLQGSALRHSGTPGRFAAAPRGKTLYDSRWQF